ncbi:D-cysteine desulfhydrase family protein [Kutzneria viridogrisea]|uniref:pyridoxal-phosphate dependent enzyme n=1 Tax=Kutzneria viridogrisea TaxID=47990 RepID=UPI001600D01A
MDLSRFPRVRLGQWPTPLQDCPRLSARLGGPTVLVKRDDVNGLGVGGNKLRKLEFLLGRALADGVDTVITSGALQTNHGRQTAAACAALGLRCELVLVREVPRSGEHYEGSGNLLLDRLYGARVHVLDTAEQAEQRRAELLADSGRTRLIPVGGSDGVGALGYVAAAAELVEQCAERGGWPTRLVVPLGSAGTAAGLVVGIAMLGWEVEIDLVSVSRASAQAWTQLRLLVDQTCEVLGVPVPPLDRVRVLDRAVGPGYGVPTDQVWQALAAFGRTEGITLDPVYTGKAAAELLMAVAEGSIDAGQTVLFLHTGGLPGLFGYAPEALTALQS